MTGSVWMREEIGMKEKRKKMRGTVVDVLLVGGAVLVAVGAGLYAFPLGLVIGGVLSIAGAVIIARGGD